MGRPKLMISSSMRAIQEAFMISLKPVSHTCIRSIDTYSLNQEGGDEKEEEGNVFPSICHSPSSRSSLVSDRLFFSPSTTKSIMEEALARTRVISYREEEEEEDCSSSRSFCNESIVVVTASADPYMDFRASMVEMVEAHGMRRWEQLLELLQCYLRLNEEEDHGAIALAFVDLVTSLIPTPFVHQV